MDRDKDADRWGGPGSSHQNRQAPQPDPLVKEAQDSDHLSPRSQVSGGGGEGDVHKGHSPEARSPQQGSSEEKRHERNNRH